MTDGGRSQLRVFFQDDDSPEILIPLPALDGGKARALAEDHALALPNGETLRVYVEVSEATRPADLLLTIQEGERMLDVRCGEFVVVGYQTAGDLYVLFQIGTGPWEADG